MEYDKYKLSLREQLMLCAQSVGITGLVAYLFYDTLWGIITMPIIYFFMKKNTVAKKIKERKNTLTEQFLDTLKAISTALLAGYSLENAWLEAQKEIGMLYGQDSLMYLELKEMNQMVSLNTPLEQIVADFAKRANTEDIENFSEIFTFAKRGGGDFVSIMDSTAFKISEKNETEKEIEVVIASKKMEQKVMNIIPLFILAYLKLTSFDYMKVLYGNGFGMCFMTMCLAAYIVSIYFAGKILEIRI